MLSIHRGATLIVTSLALAALSACGGDSTDPAYQTPPSQSATVQATPGLAFTPNQVTITTGGTVTFAFGSVQHDVFFDNAPAGAPANIPDPSANKSVERTFTTPGTYQYNCHIHPGMKGTVVVVAQ